MSTFVTSAGTLDGRDGAERVPLAGTAGMWMAVAAGVALGFAYTLSPLTVLFTPAAIAAVWLASRDLPARERHWIIGLFTAAIVIRVALIAGLFLFGEADIYNASFNVMFGDEQYALTRALRLRTMVLGWPMRGDFLNDVFEQYGRSSWLTMMAYLQLWVGRAPYGIRLLNTLFYVLACIVLHRVARRAYGPTPALVAAGFALFLPSLVIWSASALKESLYSLLSLCAITAGILVVRAPWRWKPFALLAIAGCIPVLASIGRAGSTSTTLAAIVAGWVGGWIFARRWRTITALVLAPIVVVIALERPAIQERVMGGIIEAATVHIGHVHSRGHFYRLLEPSWYEGRTAKGMKPDVAVRYVAAAVAAFVAQPIPWQVQSFSEAAYLPEQFVWYLVVVTALVGGVVGLRRDPLVTCTYGGYALFQSLAVALASGNIGTMVRHRALALPYVAALSALGAVVIATRLSRAAGEDDGGH